MKKLCHSFISFIVAMLFLTACSVKSPKMSTGVTGIREDADFGNVEVIPLNLQVDYKADDFRAQIIKSLKIMSERDGPYLLHCIEGKDRTGFLCALLECLSGASYDEIAADYMESYKNLYGIDRASDPEKYDTILGNNLVPMLRFMTGSDENADITTVDRGSGVEAYLLGGGMTEEEIGALKEKICKGSGQ